MKINLYYIPKMKITVNEETLKEMKRQSDKDGDFLTYYKHVDPKWLNRGTPSTSSGSCSIVNGS